MGINIEEKSTPLIKKRIILWHLESGEKGNDRLKTTIILSNIFVQYSCCISNYFLLLSRVFLLNRETLFFTIKSVRNCSFKIEIVCNIGLPTKAGDVEHDVSKSDLPYDLMKSLFNEEITEHEFVNELFEPWEQVNDAQAKLLGAAFEIATGGPIQADMATHTASK